ncbi:MAG: ABC transporter ATP-binding protein [Candidatus Binataceae bacterium]
MDALTIRNLSRSFVSGGGVHDVSLAVASGEFLVLLGPSGCGKSTLLRLIAGLDEPDSGAIEFADSSAPNEKRERAAGRIAMVFQNLALYPHMSAFGNIAFPLRLGKVPPAELDRRVREAAAKAGLNAGLERRPAELSGGERQRVALARALVREPEIVLMDEALSSLDARLRAALRIELKNLQRATGRTFVYVTHDQVEALALADRMAVMRAGRIEQVGRPEEVFNRPETEFVAAFVGDPAMNFFDARTAGQSAGIEIAGVRYPITLAANAPEALRAGIRPGDLSLDESEGTLAIEIAVASVEFSGAAFIVRGTLAHAGAHRDQIPICVVTPRRLEAGQTRRFHFEAKKLHLFDAVTGRRLD